VFVKGKQLEKLARLKLGRSVKAIRKEPLYSKSDEKVKGFIEVLDCLRLIISFSVVSFHCARVN
jgi:hypothetical protein